MESNIIDKLTIETESSRNHFSAKGLRVKVSGKFVVVELDGSLVAGFRASDVVKWVVEKKKGEE